MKFLFFISSMFLSLSVNANSILYYDNVSDPDAFIQKNIPIDISSFIFNPIEFSKWGHVYNISAANCTDAIDHLGLQKAFSENHWCMNFMGPSEFTFMNEKAFDYYSHEYNNPVVMNALDVHSVAEKMNFYKNIIFYSLKEICKYPSYANAEFC
nr:hypothetical protein [uncultured Tolumonas sp.]